MTDVPCSADVTLYEIKSVLHICYSKCSCLFIKLVKLCIIHDDCKPLFYHIQVQQYIAIKALPY